jgi:N-succinyl-L-ornithine transcarbamylase
MNQKAKMYHFTSFYDVDDVQKLLSTVASVKSNPFAMNYLGQNLTLGLIFFNPSIRTRLSTQKAAYNLGMNVIVMNVSQDGWQLETEDGAIMNGSKAEHVKDAVGVMGQYCDIIGVRTFAQLNDMYEDYEERVLNQFIQYAGVPILSLESAIRHPLQSFADLITIQEYTKKERPKVVLTWAPHPRALPQAVANSFIEWMSHANVELVVTHPPNYRLADQFVEHIKTEYNQRKAFEGADFVYAKNWSSYKHYGEIKSQDMNWMVTTEKMKLTNNAYFMHCLPVRRNVIVEDAVIDSERSLIIQQAANRVVSAQVVLQEMIKQIR